MEGSTTTTEEAKVQEEDQTTFNKIEALFKEKGLNYTLTTVCTVFHSF